MYKQSWRYHDMSTHCRQSDSRAIVPKNPARRVIRTDFTYSLNANMVSAHDQYAQRSRVPTLF